MMGVTLPSELVGEICADLGYSEDDGLTERALELAHEYDLDPEISHTPKAVAAGAVYFAALLEGEHLTQNQVSEAADVTRVTIRKAYREIAALEGYELSTTRSENQTERSARMAGIWEFKQRIQSLMQD